MENVRKKDSKQSGIMTNSGANPIVVLEDIHVLRSEKFDWPWKRCVK